MKKALIDDATGKVVNVITVPDASWQPADGYSLVDLGSGANPGAIYKDGKFSKSAEQVADEAAREAERIAALPQGIQAEAERRINAGMSINSLTFKTDDETMIRLRGLIDAFDASLVPPGGVSYRTKAGTTVSFPDKATAQTFYNTANQYRSAVLEASAALQQMNPVPSDFEDDKHWP